MNAMRETAKEIKTLNKLKVTMGAHLLSALSLDELHVLGLTTSVVGPAGNMKIADEAVELLRQLAKERIEAKRVSADQRMALIGERYQKVLARGLAHQLGVTEANPRTIAQLSDGGPEWASITKAVLHTAYMTGAIPALTMLDAHPGSRAGVFIVDLRDLSPFTMRDGNTITAASITARVQGKGKPS